MDKPIVGILPLFDSEKDSYWMLPGYIEGIKEAGGLPIILTFTDDEKDVQRFASMCDGFVFTGGQDVEPKVYGEEKKDVCGEICEPRDKLEGMLLKLALDEDKPILGICRGLQFINGATGGTLFQDIETEYPSNVNHRQKPPYDKPIHSVSVEKESPLFELLGKELLLVNSCHHQAIKNLSPKLSAMAKAPDGIVEAVYMPDKKFVWATQWHPEFLHKVDEDSRKIFKAFIEAIK